MVQAIDAYISYSCQLKYLSKGFLLADLNKVQLTFYISLGGHGPNAA